jgi:hypothetical protein
MSRLVESDADRLFGFRERYGLFASLLGANESLRVLRGRSLSSSLQLVRLIVASVKQRQMTWSSTRPRARARAPHEITVRAGANGNGPEWAFCGGSPPNSWVESTKSINRSINQFDLHFMLRVVRMLVMISKTPQHRKANRI